MMKPWSIVQDKYKLEIGLGRRSMYTHKHNMLKRLVLNPCRGYRRIRAFSKKKGQLAYEAGTGLIFNSISRQKKMICYHAYDWSEDVKSAYSVPLVQCTDVEVWQESTPGVCMKKGHRASMFMLQKTGILLRRDLRTGVILDEIFLPPKYKFMEIIEDREVGHLYLKSKIYSRPDDDVLSAIVIFSFPHLEFTAFLEVKRSVFGKTALKTEISQGTLLVLHSDNTIKVYSLKEILLKFLRNPYKLGETFIENNVTSCVGKHPLGLPVNVLISIAPPVLFEVKSAGHSLQIGGHPWHYIVCPTKGRHQVFSLKEKLAVEGSIEESNEVDPDVIVFHPDESLKIVHAKSSKIEIYKITQGPFPRLETFFSLDAFEKAEKEEIQKPRSSFGRKLSINNYIEGVMSLMLFDYEDELDIFAILKVKQPVLFEAPQLEAKIHLHGFVKIITKNLHPLPCTNYHDFPQMKIMIVYTDSSSGKILGSRYLPDCSWPNLYEVQYSFEIDGPLVIVKTKRCENVKSTMYVFLMEGTNAVDACEP